MMEKHIFDAKNGLWYEQCGEYQAPLPDRAEQQNDRQMGTAPPPVSPSAQVRYLYRAAADRQAGRLSGEY